MMKRTRRDALMVLMLLVLALVGSGCGYGYDGKNYVSNGGVDATASTIALDDVWIDGPSRVPAGSDTGLRLNLADRSPHGDALTSVSVPVARRARLMLHGRPVHRIAVGAWGDRDMEWRSNRDGVELIGLRRAVKPGQWFHATFRFAHSSPIRMQISVAPLAPEVRPHSTGSRTAPAAVRTTP